MCSCHGYASQSSQALQRIIRCVYSTRKFRDERLKIGWQATTLACQQSFADLILMKLMRIKQILVNDGKTLISEGIDANYVDIINYAVFALILIEEGKH